MFQLEHEENGEFFLESVLAFDQIGNTYSLDIPEEIRSLLFGENALVDPG
jgi:hypothetical protein